MKTNSSTSDNLHRTVVILGVYLYSPAYPNTKFVIDRIKQFENTTTFEICKSLFKKPPEFGKSRNFPGKYLRLTNTVLRGFYCHINVIFRFWFHRKCDVVYIPYPALGVLLMFSLLPRSCRPHKIIADAFISIYDTAVTDRKLVHESALIARFLKIIERRAYQTATLTTVDTEENRRYYSDLFSLPSSKFAAMPLSTDERSFGHTPYSRTGGQCSVLFVGTFVPLQGTEIIAKAIVKLADRRDICFTILGSGQSSELFAEIIADISTQNITWIRDWQNSESVAKYIHAADICLGIFSAGPKADRVWPFKNYAYMACGRAIITGDTTCAKRMLSEDEPAAFATVPVDDSSALADRIQDLADSPQTREQLAHNARRYYNEHLSDEVIREKLIRDIIIN